MAPRERYKLGDPRYNHPPDNGEMHYGSGLRGSVCMVEDPARKETHVLDDVTCPDCLRIRGRIMKPRDGDAQRVPLPDDMGA